MPKLKIKSMFAILDVEGNGKRLQKEIEKGNVAIVMRGSLVSAWGNFDGVSTEFEVYVDSVEVLKNKEAAS